MTKYAWKWETDEAENAEQVEDQLIRLAFYLQQAQQQLEKIQKELNK